MSSRFQRLLVTSALPYANGPLHVGHIAGAYLPGDIFCRHQRLLGREVAYICGSDEHGVPILIRSRNEGTTPQEVVDRYHGQNAESFRRLGMSFDWYGRTSAPIHHETSQDFFRTLAAKDAFVLRSEEQLFDPEAGMFLADRFVRGTCPKCGYEDAYGDQCERCGKSLSPAELVAPRSALTDARPVLKRTTHWYLPLGRMQPDLEAWLGGHQDWKPNVLGQVRSWLTDGLTDRAVTRDLPWGVAVPTDVAEAAGVDASGKVLYVWFDAPIGYVSATREWAAEVGQDWERWWKDEGTRLVHFIGKDNIVFHCLIFPAMLMAHGGYVLPDDVPSHEFLNLKGRKFSKSRGGAIWLHEALDAFPADCLRYSLASSFPETRDSDFSWEDFQGHVNSELADTLGNFINRTLSLAHKNCDGRVPALTRPTEVDRRALAALDGLPARIGERIEGWRFREALQEAMGLARLGNKYVNDTTPWVTRKTDPVACANTIHVALQLGASLSILLDPWLPEACRVMRAMLGLTGVRESGAGGGGDGLGWDDAGRPLLEAGAALGEARILFRKIEDEEIAVQNQRLEGEPEGSGDGGEPYAALKDLCVYDDFAKLDLRVGRVLEAERVPKSKKLLRTVVDLGFEKRQVLAGVAEQIEPEQLVGRQVLVVANLAPRKMMGLESQGMLLMAGERSGRLIPASAEAEPGSTVT
ncbi:MAG: methionine--tRNA ligase [Planctomycetota bacterium]